MGLQNFLSARLTAPAVPREALLTALATVATARLQAISAQDAARFEQINETDAGLKQSMEGNVQSWGALLRQLDVVGRELAHAITTIDTISMEQDQLVSTLQATAL